MTTDAQIKVRVTEDHIRNGVPGDCLRCAVALALNEATGDGECIEKDGTLYLCAWSGWIAAPARVLRFASAFDELDRMEDGRARLPEELTDDLAPFEVVLPPLNNPEWQEECHGCETLFDPDELDDEGYCEECRL